MGGFLRVGFRARAFCTEAAAVVMLDFSTVLRAVPMYWNTVRPTPVIRMPAITMVTSICTNENPASSRSPRPGCELRCMTTSQALFMDVCGVCAAKIGPLPVRAGGIDAPPGRPLRPLRRVGFRAAQTAAIATQRAACANPGGGCVHRGLQPFRRG